MGPFSLFHFEKGKEKGKGSPKKYLNSKYLVMWCAKSLQLCPTLWDPMDHSLPGFFVHRILQTRTLEWVAVSSSRGSSWSRDWTYVSKSPALAGKLFTTRATWEAKILGNFYKFYGIFHCNQDIIAERKVKLLSCPTLRYPIDYSLTRLLRLWIFQARVL